MVSLPKLPGTGPTPTPPMSTRVQPLFNPTTFKHHPLYETTTMATFTSPSRPSNSSAVSRVVSSSTFSSTFQGGNYTDSGLGSFERKEKLVQRQRERKRQAAVERAKMKQELLKLEEIKRQRRYKLRELKRRAIQAEVASVVVIQRYYRGFKTRKRIARERRELREVSVKKIIQAYRTYCIVRIAKADRGVLDKIKVEDAAVRMLQGKVRLWKLRKQAVAEAARRRDIREKERLEFIRQLREKACIYVQRVFRGIMGRSRVVKIAVEKQIMEAQERVERIQGPIGEAEGVKRRIDEKRNKYKSIATPKNKK